MVATRSPNDAEELKTNDLARPAFAGLTSGVCAAADSQIKPETDAPSHAERISAADVSRSLNVATAKLSSRRFRGAVS